MASRSLPARLATAFWSRPVVAGLRTKEARGRPRLVGAGDQGLVRAAGNYLDATGHL